MTLMVYRHGVIMGLYLHPLLDEMMRNGVIMLVIFNVVINMHACLLDLGVLVRVCRQPAQEWFIQLFELALTRPGQLLKRPLVQVF